MNAGKALVFGVAFGALVWIALIGLVWVALFA